MAGARPYRPGGARKGLPLHEVIAGAILEERRHAGGHAGFVQAADGTCYRYTGTFWKPVSDDTLLHLAHMAGARRVTLRREVVATIKASCHVEGLEFGRVGDHEIPAANGVLDVRSMTLRAHRPEDYLDSVLPVAWDAGAVSPALDGALGDWFDDEEERPAALQEYAGYVCLAHAKWKKALVLYGPGDTGKSTFVKILRALVGPEFCCSLPVDDMDDPVARSVIWRKRLNTISELSAEAMIADGGFKTLVSTEESILINPKYVAPLTIVPTAKHVIATNTLPRIDDRTEATHNRLSLVPFDRVLEVKDPALEDRLLAQLAGILVWAAKGAARLVASGGQFSTVSRADELRRAMKEESNPAIAFVKERMKAEAGAAETLSKVADAINKWNAGARKLDVRRVGKLMRAAGIEVGDIWSGTGSAKGVKGWRLLNEAELQAQEREWKPPDPPGGGAA